MAASKPRTPRIQDDDAAQSRVVRPRPQSAPSAAEPPPLPEQMAVLPVRDMVLFPGTIVPLNLDRPRDRQLVNDMLPQQKIVAIVAQKSATAEEPGEADLYAFGTAAMLLKLLRREDGTQTIIVHGLSRVKLAEYVQQEPYLLARVEPQQDRLADSKVVEALEKNARQMAREIIDLSPNVPDEAVDVLANIQDSGTLSDFLASNLQIDPAKKQQYLEQPDVRERLEQINVELRRQLDLLELTEKIQQDVREKIAKDHREHFLQEQMRAIQKELGVLDEKAAEIDALRDRLRSAGMPEPVQSEAMAQLERMARIPVVSPEYTVQRTYLDVLVELPWQTVSEDNLDVARARRILDEDHYDLDKVKKRILEFLAVRKLAPESRGPILCFVGPPGVGKTSLGQSIARALGRKFIRMSLGGVRDEAELRGHRRTYIGAMPGRIIQEIRKAGTANPVFMLDELDKVGADFRGDPTSALLEVLDPAQNQSFQDHYLATPFDLSRVLFIATANYMAPVPPALRDRLETLELPGYTLQEKMHIAEKYLVPRQLSENGLTPSTARWKSEALRAVIEDYTREAGVRELERQIGSVCRHVAALIAEGKARSRTINRSLVQEALGKPIYTPELAGRTALPGVVTGLAQTPVGGTILFVEATSYPGKGSLILTGQIGDVMRESAQAAFSLIKSKAENIGLKPEQLAGTDIHVHVPAGAIPKDGPSAGIAMLTALTSLLTNIRVSPEIAMTGEITLRGLVLPIGGVRAKVLAARRAGIRRVLLPEANRKDLVDVPAEVREELEFVFVSTADDVMNAALDGLGGPESDGRSRGKAAKKRKRVR